MATLARQAAKKIINDSRFREAKADNDTVRLWENYREQALLWRALALLQIPGTFIALFFALVMWINRETILNVPAKPLPGYYAASEIPDAEFISVASDWVNLVATYQPLVVSKQFDEAARWLVEPMLTRFKTEMLEQEVATVKNTMRSQVYYVDPTRTMIERDEEDNVIVTLVGERLKIVAGINVPSTITQFRITMTTQPRNKLNEYGIVIINAESTDTKVG
ncbi:MAG: hypothetical protein GX589_00630 [Deltaproteobacteria bacterium]|nr:hypothetical protein [Deltaproteobacteria bacterium]